MSNKIPFPVDSVLRFLESLFINILLMTGSVYFICLADWTVPAGIMGIIGTLLRTKRAVDELAVSLEFYHAQKALSQRSNSSSLWG